MHQAKRNSGGLLQGIGAGGEPGYLAVASKLEVTDAVLIDGEPVRPVSAECDVDLLGAPLRDVETELR